MCTFSDSDYDPKIRPFQILLTCQKMCFLQAHRLLPPVSASASFPSIVYVPHKNCLAVSVATFRISRPLLLPQLFLQPACKESIPLNPLYAAPIFAVLSATILSILTNLILRTPKMVCASNPYGNGCAYKRIADIIESG